MKSPATSDKQANIYLKSRINCHKHEKNKTALTNLMQKKWNTPLISKKQKHSIQKIIWKKSNISNDWKPKELMKDIYSCESFFDSFLYLCYTDLWIRELTQWVYISNKPIHFINVSSLIMNSWLLSCVSYLICISTFLKYVASWHVYFFFSSKVILPPFLYLKQFKFFISSKLSIKNRQIFWVIF